MYAEIKYDGERVQVHKNGDDFQYFSRSLKPVLPHKVREQSAMKFWDFCELCATLGLERGYFCELCTSLGLENGYFWDLM